MNELLRRLSGGVQLISYPLQPCVGSGERSTCPSIFRVDKVFRLHRVAASPLIAHSLISPCGRAPSCRKSQPRHFFPMRSTCEHRIGAIRQGKSSVRHELKSYVSFSEIMSDSLVASSIKLFENRTNLRKLLSASEVHLAENEHIYIGRWLAAPIHYRWVLRLYSPAISRVTLRCG